MRCEFHCPYWNRMITEDECYDGEETPLCQACTSEMDTKRKALYDWLTVNYGGRFAIAMEDDGIGIAVHEKMHVLADPCDEDGDSYLGVTCGGNGGTHSHPSDMQKMLAELLESRMTIGLDDTGHVSCWSSRELFKRETDRINQWQTLVDAEGCYTPDAYAKKLGVTLPGRDLRFHCPERNGEITEYECDQRCRDRRRSKVCKACAGKTMTEAGVAYVAEKLLPYCGNVKLLRSKDRTTLYMKVHGELMIELAPVGLEGDGYISFRLEGWPFTHGHPAGREMLEDLIPFLKGEKVLVLASGLIDWSSYAFVMHEELRADWSRCTKGSYVRICDLLGVWKKKEYQEYMGQGGNER